MYYSQAELDSSLPPDFPSTKKEFLSLARSRGELLTHEQGRYKAWGPYWWVMKAFLRRFFPAQRAWFMKNNQDPELPSLLPDLDDDPTGFRRLVWAAERYAKSGLEDALAEVPGELHLIDLPQEGVVLYSLQDADAAWQLDLFDQDEAEKEKQQNSGWIMASTASTWRIAGDNAMASGNLDRAGWAYRRMIAAARTELEQNEAWIRLAQCFDRAKKTEMAVFCYLNLQGQNGMNWIWGETGRIYLEAGAWAKAFECFSRACQLMPGNPEYRWGYQQTLEKLALPGSLKLAGA